MRGHKLSDENLNNENNETSESMLEKTRAIEIIIRIMVDRSDIL